ncbi:hypothetical protein ARMSODRAFT_1056595 [Armillaria solidipes]|uniref:Fatty acid desaturase domain-containing protein n=1 Tax=Armillaria solidipes TaxID=1076256 RepID=A0A2H3BHN4_9AGAR|nr:hypothetical protein ARMSODRAFT_1056595 [Armillaria solidipes]
MSTFPPFDMVSATPATSKPELDSQHVKSAELPVFTPLPYTIAQIRAAIPSDYFVLSTSRALITLARDIFMTISHTHSKSTPPFYAQLHRPGIGGSEVLHSPEYGCSDHECGHGAFSHYTWLNDSLGFILHTFLWTPYFSWKIGHHRHHLTHASMEHDEVYVPKTRAILGIPSKEFEEEHGINWEYYFGETPIWTLMMLIRQQVLAFPAYLTQRNAIILDGTQRMHDEGSGTTLHLTVRGVFADDEGKLGLRHKPWFRDFKRTKWPPRSPK